MIDIEALARKAGGSGGFCDPTLILSGESIEQFAKLIAAECARICADRANLYADEGGDAGSCEFAIREEFGLTEGTENGS